MRATADPVRCSQDANKQYTRTLLASPLVANSPCLTQATAIHSTSSSLQLLFLDHFVQQALAASQLVVGPCLCNTTTLEHSDPVGRRDGRQAVRDRDCSDFSLHEISQGGLHVPAEGRCVQRRQMSESRKQESAANHRRRLLSLVGGQLPAPSSAHLPAGHKVFAEL
jgi:hypothetical protein